MYPAWDVLCCSEISMLALRELWESLPYAHPDFRAGDGVSRV